MILGFWCCLHQGWMTTLILVLPTTSSIQTRERMSNARCNQWPLKPRARAVEQQKLFHPSRLLIVQAGPDFWRIFRQCRAVHMESLCGETNRGSCRWRADLSRSRRRTERTIRAENCSWAVWGGGKHCCCCCCWGKRGGYRWVRSALVFSWPVQGATSSSRTNMCRPKSSIY